MKLENLQISEWRGYVRHDFTFNERAAIVVLPKAPVDANPWVWRAEFFAAFDTVDMALLERGYALLYYTVSDMYGCPESISLMKTFRDYIAGQYNLSEKAAMFGFSRGGLYTVGYTAAYPDDISVIYLDAPVCDITSWPAGFGSGEGDPDCWVQCKRCYNLDDESAKTFKGNPIDKVEALVKSNIPCILVAGLIDATVPYGENGERFVAEYKRLSGDIKTILKPDCDHHPHSLDDPSEIVDFILIHK